MTKLFHIFNLLIFLTVIVVNAEVNIERWDLFEVEMDGTKEGNPYLDINLSATFTNQNLSVTVPGFYDGNGKYRIRFSPIQIGEWKHSTESDLNSLDNQNGSFQCIKATGNNHGPLKIVNTFYLEYADGSPFYSVGTTAYQWTSVKQSIQEQTIQTLSKSPFNKIRMCFFPKWYLYGIETEPWQYPYESKTDFSKPNFAFFKILITV